MTERFTVAPISLLQEPYCEELADPHLVSKGKFGYKPKRDILLTPRKCYNQGLLNYSDLHLHQIQIIFSL